MICFYLISQMVNKMLNGVLYQY